MEMVSTVLGKFGLKNSSHFAETELNGTVVNMEDNAATTSIEQPSKSDEVDSQSYKDFEEMIENMEIYEDEYISEYSEKKTPTTPESGNQESSLDNLSFKSFEDIFDALETFKNGSRLVKPEVRTTNDFNINNKENLEVITTKSEKTTNDGIEFLNTSIEEPSTSVIHFEKAIVTIDDHVYDVPTNNQPSEEFNKNVEDNSRVYDEIATENDSYDSEFDSESSDSEETNNKILVKPDDGEHKDSPPVEVIVHNPESVAVANEIALRRSSLFSTFNMVKRMFKAAFCIPEPGEEYTIERRPYGLTAQEWMIFVTSVLVFLGCCIVIAVVGLRYRECASIALSQGDMIKNLMSDKDVLNQFIKATKYYNATLYNLIENEKHRPLLLSMRSIQGIWGNSVKLASISMSSGEENFHPDPSLNLNTSEVKLMKDS